MITPVQWLFLYKMPIEALSARSLVEVSEANVTCTKEHEDFTVFVGIFLAAAHSSDTHFGRNYWDR